MDDNGRLSLAFQDLEAVPDQVADANGPTAVELDLTENAIQYVKKTSVRILLIFFARRAEILGTW
jgi:hypothetical protein